MGLKPDWWIKQQVGMIDPFVDHQVRNGNISYGLSSYGYDMRVANEFKILYPPSRIEGNVIDPKNFDQDLFYDIETDVCVIPPNSFVLARSVEYFEIPADVLGVCLGKSTYARCGISVNITPMESGWKGVLVVEIANLSSYPAKIYANEGIAQVLFFEGDAPCEVSYAARNGKYQNQYNIVTARV